MLLINDINLYGYYLLLDVYLELGNNVQLVKLLGICVQGEIEFLLFYGEFDMLLNVVILCEWLEKLLECLVLYCGDCVLIDVCCIVWCIGGG